MANTEQYNRNMDMMEYATPEEKQPFNNYRTDDYHHGHTKIPNDEPEVVIHTTKRQHKSGCYMSAGQATGLFFFVLFLIGLTGLLVFFLALPKCEEEPEESFYLSTYKPKPTVEPGLPWSSIRLPNHYEPSFYELELKVDLSNFVFEGSVEVHFKAKDATEYIILHTNSLEITQTGISVKQSGSSHILDIVDQIEVPTNQFYVLQMALPLQRNRKYTVEFKKFKGMLQDDLRGIYRSSYKDNNGNTRLVKLMAEPWSYKVCMGCLFSFQCSSFEGHQLICNQQ